MSKPKVRYGLVKQWRRRLRRFGFDPWLRAAQDELSGEEFALLIAGKGKEEGFDVHCWCGCGGIVGLYVSTLTTDDPQYDVDPPPGIKTSRPHITGRPCRYIQGHQHHGQGYSKGVPFTRGHKINPRKPAPIGERWNYLTCVEELPSRGYRGRERRFLFKCDCGEPDCLGFKEASLSNVPRSIETTP